MSAPEAAARPKQNSSHWGVFLARDLGSGIEVTPSPRDPAPSAVLGNIAGAVRHPARVAQPVVREGWLIDGPGPSRRRGSDRFVAISWDQALELAAEALRRAYESPAGARSVFGGSYGWSSAGRFNHAQSQVHRFLNTLGGYVASRTTYSSAAAEIILARVVADWQVVANGVTWPDIVEHTELVVSFGGMAVKNAAVAPGGINRHLVDRHLADAAARGCRFVLVSPIRDDLPDSVDAEQLPIRPGTDTALMLGIAHTLAVEGLVDHDFLRRCTVGYERFERYLLGDDDGLAKSADWAAAQSGIPAETIIGLARRMAAGRTLVAVSYSLQRAEHGEQPVWMGLTLSAMLGQFGAAGAGFTFALGAMGHIGRPRVRMKLPSLPQGVNPVTDAIPVARIADMLLAPGERFDFDGQSLVYPDIRLVYWAGGNPFHHHQDLRRLSRALAKPDTIIVHEPFWTPMARHADLVLPATTTLEREDIGAGFNDSELVAMHRIVEPVGQARDDYAIFTALAQRLGVAEAFTEGRDQRQWLEHLYEGARGSAATEGVRWPSFDDFWEAGSVPLPADGDLSNAFRAFREDPQRHPLPTPSGRIEIFSSTIDSFGYDDCRGHPAWFPPVEGWRSDAAARFPLQLIANQPATRLHSQLDMGAHSQDAKVQGREPIRIHPSDAADRGIDDGTVVRVFNDRGACLAGAVLSDAVRPGVVQLSTGAWYDPVGPDGMCAHGNPNVLTRDAGTSRLAQGCTGQLTLVEIEPYRARPPEVGAHRAPPIVTAAAVTEPPWLSKPKAPEERRERRG